MRFAGVRIPDNYDEIIERAIENDDDIADLETLKRDLEHVQKQIAAWNKRHQSNGNDVDEWCVFEVSDTLSTVNHLITKRVERIRDEGE